MYPGTHAATSPHRAAVVVAETGEAISYAALEEGSARLARLCAESGLRRGDVVALVADNTPRVFEVYWAAQRSGLYLTTVNHHLSPAEMAYIISDSGARAVVVSAPVAAATVGLPAECPGVERWFSYGGTVPGFADLDTAAAGVSAEPLDDQPRGADLLYSSGTTGRPKGIKPPLPDRQVDEPGDPFVAAFGPRYGFGPDTVYLCPAPLHHSAPLRFCATVQALGGTVVLMRRFDAEATLAAIERYGVTHGQFVPTMFVRLLKLPAAVRDRYELSTLRVAVHAAAPCPVEVKLQMIDWWGPILHEYYSSTEANGITFVDSAQWLAKPGSVGQAGLGTVRICDESGRLLSAGEVGLVYFEREQLPFRYHRDEAKTRAAQHPEHPTWTTTGDLGSLDEEGFLFLADRRAFLIISGGVNIYPQEVEDALALHPAVFDVAVIGVPDEDMGQAVKAVVQPAEGVTAGPDLGNELIEYVRSRIAHFKAPRTVDFVAALPRTETGKLRKTVLVEQYKG